MIYFPPQIKNFFIFLSLVSLSVLVRAQDKGLVEENTAAQERVAETPLKAQTQKKDPNMEKLAVIGTRSSARSIGDSAVPIDIISSKQIRQQGLTDMTSMLETLIPSFNVSDQAISDDSSFIRPANLRGLPSDHTLVLVNGKRRHRGAVISLLGGPWSRGSQGPDISTIPAIALKQVEVLRDGASAQYGSDAIAGAINFVLKDSQKGGAAQVQYGLFSEGDGGTLQYTGNIGFPITKKGFANISFESRQAAATDRSLQHEEAAALIEAGNTAVANPAQPWGIPRVDQDLKLFVNSGLELTPKTDLYLFGNYAQRALTEGFYFRSPQHRKGVFVNSDSTQLLVGDTTDDNSGNCPTIPLAGVANVLDNETYKQDVLGNENCWAFNERYPGGFTPQFGGSLQDISLATGLKGEAFNDWMYDLGLYWGQNRIDFSMENSVNASLGPESPSSFKPGGRVQDEKSVDLDIHKVLEVGLAEPLSFAFGATYRQESFENLAGEEASYKAGDLAAQGFSIGSNGFQGINPRHAQKNSRNNTGVYLDLGTYLTNDWAVNTALRYENFSDFGNTTNGKISTHYQFLESLAARGALSTGFKAPTIGQNNIRVVTTRANTNGELIDDATLPPSNPISQLKGATELTPETSVNMSLGLVSELDNGLLITLDYFRIDIQDRISTTSGIDLTEEDKQALLGQGITDAAQFSKISFFTNDFSSTTQGVDLVINYDIGMLGGKTDFTFLFNWTDTKITKVRSFDLDNNSGTPATKNISDAHIQALEEGIPNTRYSFVTNHANGPWNFMGRLNYYGAVLENAFDEDTIINTSAAYTVDMEVSYQFNRSFQFLLGAQNLLDQRPDDNPIGRAVGFRYPEHSPIGINGGFYYARASYFF